MLPQASRNFFDYPMRLSFERNQLTAREPAPNFQWLLLLKGGGKFCFFTTGKGTMSTKTKFFVLLTMLALTFVALVATPARALGGVLYVTPDGIGDCTTWGNSCSLQTALSVATSGNDIWVKAGTYKPGISRSATFKLVAGVGLYGGFAGTETTRPSCNLATNVTILSGEIGEADTSDNVYHVVTGVSGATLECVTVIGGNADGASPDDTGGGMYNNASDPTVKNVIFKENFARKGGGMNNSASSPALTNVTFVNNSATNGGGLYNDAGSDPALTTVSFSLNQATTDGGGLYNYSSSPTLTNVTFSDNTAAVNGGGMATNGGSPTLVGVTFMTNTATTSGGGMYNYSSSPTLTNVTLSGNAAADGGGVWMYGSAGSNPTFTNVTISGNSATGDGGGLYNKNSSDPQIQNTIFWGNTAANGAQVYNFNSTAYLSDSVVQGGCPTGSTCQRIITANPLLGALGSYNGPTRTIPLLPGSSAIDAGNDATCAAIDQRLIARPQVASCDIGAFESRGFVLTKTNGDNQTATVGALFTKPLVVTVTADFAIEPVDGGEVTFTAPASGASTEPAINSATIVSGKASQPVTANATAGTYTVTASASGAASTVAFTLTNKGLPIIKSCATTNITGNSATLTCVINPNDNNVVVAFQYGPTTSYGTPVPGVPSPISGSTDTTVHADLTGLTPNLTYHWRVLLTYNGAVYPDVDRTFKTLAIPPSAVTLPATNVTLTSATLNSKVNANNADTTVSFEYGLDTSYGSTVSATPSPVSGTTDTPVSANLTDLTPHTLYHYRIKATNSAGTTYGNDETFTTDISPVVKACDTTNITGAGATLNCTINPSDNNVAVTFQYGTTTSYGKSAAGVPSSINGSADVLVSADISGLAQGITYHWRVVLTYGSGGTAYGTDQSFITPIARTDPATLVTTNSARLNGLVNAKGGNLTVSFEYGPDTTYGGTIAAIPGTASGATNTPVYADLSGLASQTTYHFRVVAQNSDGGKTYGADQSFTTGPWPPTVISCQAKNITATAATLSCVINPQGNEVDVTFEYGPTTSYGTSIPVAPIHINGSANVTVSAKTATLLPNKTYHWRVVLTYDGGAHPDIDRKFTTLVTQPIVTTTPATKVYSTFATLNGKINPKGNDVTAAFEICTASGVCKTVPAVPKIVTGHVVKLITAVANGLQANTSYRYRAIGTYGGNKQVYGSYQIFITKPIGSDFTLSPNSVNETLAIDTLVGQFSVASAEPGVTYTFSLVSGLANCAATNNASFKIVGAQLKTKSVFDYETKNKYLVCVRITDSLFRSREKPFTVNVTNVLDEIVKNGSFEKYPADSKLPIDWSAFNFGVLDGQDNIYKNSGFYSVKIIGAAQPKTLTQMIYVSGAAGDKFIFSYAMRGSTPAGGICQGQVMLYNGTTLKQTRTVPCPARSYLGFTQSTPLTFLATAAYNRVDVVFTYTGANATVWFDDASLLR
jgi:phosphodiesterase/alkaline phosphatase D-like protein